MGLPGFSIRKPVTILMVTLIVCFMGLISLFYIPVELMPNITYGEISIIVNIRGGIPPTEVESLVSKPVEEAVSTVSNLESLLSISKEGESTVVMSFKPGTDMNFASLEVREKFAKVKNKLPKEIERPVIANYKYSDYPVIILAFISKRYSPEMLRKIIEETLEEPIKRVAGVANVEIGGGRERKILVEVDQSRQKANAVTIDMVLAAVGRNNLNLLTGDVLRDERKFLIRAMGEFTTLEEIKNIGVAVTPGGSIIRLKDVASVKDSYLEPSTFARLNERPVVSVYIQKESTANTITVSKGIKDELAKVKGRIPKEIEMVTTYDQADGIKKAIDTVNVSLLQGGLLAILVLLFFLTEIKRKYIIPLLVYMGVVLFIGGKPLFAVTMLTILAFIFFKRFRFVLTIAISIPISVLITFSVMYLLNMGRASTVSLNIMTLTGLALGIGMLVDNSIVVLENIFTYWGKPMDPRARAEKAAEEMTLVIVAGTLTTLVVFLPILFVNVETKLLYGGVALTVTISLLASLAVALSAVPLIASRMKEVARGAEWMEALYKWYSKWVFKALRYRYALIISAFISFLGAIAVFGTFDKEFIASAGQSDFTIFVKLAAGTRLEVCDSACRKVEEVLKKIPEVKTSSSRVESGLSKVYVRLVPSTQRRRTTKQVIDSIRSEVETIKLYFPQDESIYQPFIYFEEPQEAGSREIVLDLYGYDYKALRELAGSIASRMGNIKGLTDTRIRMREGSPELGLKVDKQLAASYGMDTSQVAMAVHGQMRGLRATYYHTKGKEVEAVVRLDEKYRKTFEDVRRLVLPTKENSDIFLGQVVEFKYGLGPSEIWRKDKMRVVQVSANMGSLPLGRTVKEIKKALKDVKFPENYYYEFGGNYPTLLATQKQFLPTILLTLALIYMVLASLYESYTQPFIIMASVPLSMVGITLSLLIAHISVSIGVVVGIIMLGGIDVNKSVILVDKINHLRGSGMSLLKAVVMGGRSRLRPILMTSFTTILGLLPMAVDRSESAGLWSPLAITVIGGLTSSTVLTLFVIPCIYIAWEDLKEQLVSFAARYDSGLGLKWLFRHAKTAEICTKQN
ncbi:MAG: efflux RND transporter permease subunit [Candidatus Omnitrophica bacterium]|nr:efflux RND transporter permease subunit [Candidatus Omnitrophota bacterium]